VTTSVRTVGMQVLTYLVERVSEQLLVVVSLTGAIGVELVYLTDLEYFPVEYAYGVVSAVMGQTVVETGMTEVTTTVE